MEYEEIQVQTVKRDLKDFKAWSRGKTNLDTLKLYCTTTELKLIEDFIIESLYKKYFKITSIQINDFLCDKRDLLVKVIGYENFDSFITDRKA